jgi:nucleoside-triphosphatase THEP1
MPTKNLLIYIGPIKSGKSSRLYDFSKNRKNFAGILSLSIDNKKWLYSIRTKEQKLLEVNKLESNGNTITCGKYVFDKKVFKWARGILNYDLEEKPELIILDEIGPLELSGGGLAPTSFEIIKKSIAGELKTLVVIRENLLNKFFEYVKISKQDVDFFNFDLPV